MKPRLGFLGTGWIGRQRMVAMLETGSVEAAGLCDPDPACLGEARRLAPQAVEAGTLEGLLAHDLDGLVIATPSALHAAQAIAALERGVAVFCQKPLSRTAEEAGIVIEAARRADRLLGVDFSYRETEALKALRQVVDSAALGRIYAIDLVFHNAYGPDKPWFFDLASSGGGCVMDLGIHLIDALLWILGYPPVTDVRSRLFAGGEALGHTAVVEDFAVAELDLGTGAVARLACSWKLPAGKDAEIEISFYGTEGGVTMRNLEGSFVSFVAEHRIGTSASLLTSPGDDWPGRAAAAWARRLAAGQRFDPAAEAFVTVAQVVDRIYGRGSAP